MTGKGNFFRGRLNLALKNISAGAHAFFEVTVDAECAQHQRASVVFAVRLGCLRAGLIRADVQHQGEADLFPGKGSELWASLWQEA
jgi:hypothetical protein